MLRMPIITTPFDRVAIDLVGPLSPVSSEGHRYILTLVDYATSYPEAVPMREITSVAVTEALLTIFSRVGIPRELISDRGAQFTSELMGEIHRLVGIKPIFTTPYHPMMNGRIERQHAILKSVLKKLCSDKPNEWHRYLVPTLFAMREPPSGTLGFSPFELLYGRRVRGTLSILHDMWADNTVDQDTRTTFNTYLN
jgi:transposase InsO family protein